LEAKGIEKVAQPTGNNLAQRNHDFRSGAAGKEPFITRNARKDTPNGKVGFVFQRQVVRKRSTLFVSGDKATSFCLPTPTALLF